MPIYTEKTIQGLNEVAFLEGLYVLHDKFGMDFVVEDGKITKIEGGIEL